MTNEEILDKHWANFKRSLGHEYEPMSDRAKEHLLAAINECIEQAVKNITDDMKQIKMF